MEYFSPQTLNPLISRRWPYNKTASSFVPFSNHKSCNLYVFTPTITSYAGRPIKLSYYPLKG